MNRTEALAILSFVHAACPAMRMDEQTPEAWALLLADLDYQDAQQAVVNLGKRQAFIAPADINQETRRLRTDRLSREASLEPPDADPDDVPAYLEAVRSGRTRRVDQDRLVQRNVRQVISGAFRRTP